MNVVAGLPPIYEKIVAAIGKPPDTAIYTYGDTVYNPSNGPLDEHLLAHEATHVKQQAKIGADVWWARFLSDPTFRTDQEVQAYEAQVRSFANRYRDRNAIARYAVSLAQDLSGSMYGRPISFTDAYRRIR